MSVLERQLPERSGDEYLSVPQPLNDDHDRSDKSEPTEKNTDFAWVVTRACWRASEWGSARKSLSPRARRSEGIVCLRAPHVRPNLGSADDWSERVTVINPHAPENVVRAHVRLTLEVGDLVFAGEDAVHRLIVYSDREHCQ
ncbi:jg3276 [Pararge aegeria aegeria]|uniref:Jg3276 protein n=1 Tax=Pararge aegeria aegeria TaxID=348720 RepID=A0A8S4RS18_9NEOP|nr:jg3276 [Pararge aegeria aegeria]